MDEANEQPRWYKHPTDSMLDVQDGGAMQYPEERIDAVVSRLYRRFKDWSKRGFGPDDVTWCEVKADVLQIIAETSKKASDSPQPQNHIIEDAYRRKVAEFEAGGLLPKKEYACPYCLAGFIPIQSSISGAMVHPDTPAGRIVCEGRDKPTVLFPLPAQPREAVVDSFRVPRPNPGNEKGATCEICGAVLVCLSCGNHRESEQPQGETLQERVAAWMLACFGADIAADKAERNHRFLEESLELVQSCGCTREEARQLVEYVFDRPIGERSQEVGGVLVTLATLCNAQCIDMQTAGGTEVARIWGKIDQIRQKQAAKPKHSPLPAQPQGETQECDLLAAEKARREAHHRESAGKWTTGLIKCHDCDGYQIYEFSDGDLVIRHSCFAGTMVHEWMSQRDAELTALRAEIVTLEQQNEALREKYEGCPHKPLDTAEVNDCGCSYDKVGDVCDFHAPALRKAQTDAEALRARMEEAEHNVSILTDGAETQEKQTAALRAALKETADALREIVLDYSTRKYLYLFQLERANTALALPAVRELEGK